MPITTVKSSMSFPEAGQIRKGGAKQKQVKNGREYETVGKDLGQALRLVVFEGRDSAYITAKLLDLYGGLTTDKPILCMLPFQRVSECWEVWNEAYSAGRMVMRADGEHYIRLIDPESGAMVVDDGQPYKPFNGEREIRYTRGDRQYVLPIKPTGRLKLFLPELERFVWFTLKTTSYYDAINLEAQLGAIQNLADSLNGGSCAGIRFYLYRTQKDVTWNKPDGTASRVTKWLLNVEVDPEWVKSAIGRLNQFALTGHGTAAALLPQPIIGTVDPDEPEHDEDEPEIIIPGEKQPNTEPGPGDVIFTLATKRPGLAGKTMREVAKLAPDVMAYLVSEDYLPSDREGIEIKRAATMLAEEGDDVPD